MDDLIERLYQQYKHKGFLSEDEILLEFEKTGISFVQMARVTNALLAKGVLISSEDFNLSEDDVQSLDRARLDYNVIYEKILKKDPALETLINYVKRIKPPQLREIDSIIPQVSSGNSFAANRMFEMHMRLALKVAYQKSEEYDLNLSDTVQDALRGLWTSVRRYDKSKHGPFPAYAYLWMTNHIGLYRHFDDSLWDIPSNKKKMYEDIYKFILQYDPFYFEFPILDEHLIDRVCCVTSYDRDDVINCLMLIADVLEYKDPLIKQKDDCLEEVLLHAALRRAFDCLEKKELFVIRSYYFKNKTLRDIAAVLKVSHERVRQIEDKAIRKLKPHLSKYEEYFP